MGLYNNDVKLQLLIGSIWSLAYFPLDMVTTILETLIQEKVWLVCLEWEEDFGSEIASFFKYVHGLNLD
jgi:hypothetical protein